MNWVDLGLMPYQDAWDLQRQIAQARAENLLDDTLLMVQHPHVYTLGRSGDMSHLLMSEEDRDRLGVAVIQTDRGGDITYHGPGQLVAYPIITLGRPDSSGRMPQMGYIRRLEGVIIETLASFGIESRREQGLTGVWVDTPNGPEKIAAIGVKVTAASVSMHGLALNVDPDLQLFSGIVPCGIADRGVTSMKRLLNGNCPSVSETGTQFRVVFESVFNRLLHEVPLPDLISLLTVHQK